VGFDDEAHLLFWTFAGSAGLILFGRVFFSLFIALVSVALIGRNMDALGANVQQIEQRSNRIQTGEDRILAELAQMDECLKALEQQLSSNTA
jgi:hypothetical protein